jgi:hypothetical protein
MTFLNIFRSLCILSGAVAGIIAAAAKDRDKRSRREASAQSAAQRRDYFSITKARGKPVDPKWILQGFGRFECLLFFNTWREAMDQASFQIEHLAAGELIQLERH